MGTMTDWRWMDSRELLEELKGYGVDDWENPDYSSVDDEDERDAAEAIVALFEEVSDYAGDSPRDGIFFIASSEFVDYARELAEDIGAINTNASWPLNYIDWPAAARALEQDYMEVEYDGRMYFYR